MNVIFYFFKTLPSLRNLFITRPQATFDNFISA